MDAIAPVDLSTEEGPGDGSIRRRLAGGVDVLVNNASAIVRPHRPALLRRLVVHRPQRTRHLFLVTRAAWPYLVAAGEDLFVNVASISASRGAFFMPQNAHGAAKGGVLALTDQLVVEGGPHGSGQRRQPGDDGDPQTSPI